MSNPKTITLNHFKLYTKTFMLLISDRFITAIHQIKFVILQKAKIFDLFI